jgi:hypothetical protein
LRADHPPDLIQPKGAAGQMRDMKMAFMRRIERSAQQPDPHAATVMEQARMLVTAGNSGIRQV